MLAMAFAASGALHAAARSAFGFHLAAAARVRGLLPGAGHGLAHRLLELGQQALSPPSQASLRASESTVHANQIGSR
jgi:hypothetical protein